MHRRVGEGALLEKSPQMLPIIEKDFGEEAGQDAEVAHGEDVDVDNVSQRVDHCQEEKQQ